MAVGVDVGGTVGMVMLRGGIDEVARATAAVLPFALVSVGIAIAPTFIPPAPPVTVVAPAAVAPAVAAASVGAVRVRMISRMDRLHNGQLWAFWNQCSMHAAWNT